MPLKTNFGLENTAYKKGRRPFPQKVITYLWEQNINKSPRILDIGCGTGIATRQLAQKKKINVVGLDADALMIKKAKQQNDKIDYVIGTADKLPYKDETFDIVTAFSSFHWFQNKKSLDEIRRVLKKQGLFFIVNHFDMEGFRIGFRDRLETILHRKIPLAKRNYQPELLLRTNRFKEIKRKFFYFVEEHSLKSALSHIQSSYAWTLIPEETKETAVVIMKTHIKSQKKRGKVFRLIRTQIVHGRKK
jgi:ubiquinone/menaquinone biosynthesis C-methylase UbiE